mgnify:CR=1 FL=1
MKAPGSKLQCNANNNRGIAGLATHPLTALMFATGMLPGWSLANTITPDRTTATTVDVAGNLSDIRTGTVRGKTGFNSFDDFKVSQGNVVNLHVPGSATHLVNLVNNSRAEINGTLNGVMNGNIGGHIIFADPHGFVVGSSGVVNVGSLTVTTPNTSEMARLRDLVKPGVNDDVANALVDDLVAGRLSPAALNGDGSNVIIIDGLVNTNGALNLQGASVIVGATAHLQAGTDAARTVFESTVNTHGLSIGTDAVRGDGGIRITAAQDVNISGELAALMADDSGASVRIAGNQSVVLAGDALIDVRGAPGKDAGDVIIEAPSVKLQDKASVITRASGVGTSGDITLNALSDLSCTFCDESADAQTLDQLKTGIEGQANPWLSANLGKAEIVVAKNALLDAGHEDEGGRAGDVTLNAFAINRQLAGYAEASALIEVDGNLNGKNISLHADSRAEVARDILGSLLNTDALKADIAALKELNNWTEEETWANILDTLYEPIAAYENSARTDAFLDTPTNFTELTLLVPGLAAYIAKADSQVIIGTAADLVASADIHLLAESKRTVDSSTWQIPGLGSKIPFGFSAAYGQISGLTAVDVRRGAQLSAGDDLSVLAHSLNKLAVTSAAENSVDGNGNALKTMGLGFGMAMSDIETRAVVENGVLLRVGEDVNVTALTEQSLSNTVSFKASGEGATGGPAVGLSLLDSVTRAEFSADLADVRNLNLTAANLVHAQTLAVTVEAGASEPGYLDKLKAKAKEQVADPVTDYLGDAVKGLFGITPKPADDTPAQPTDSQFRLASALGISMADHRVEAVLGSADAAPDIALSGDLTVQALQQQSDLHTTVASKVNASAKRDDGSVDGAAVSLSVAAAYSELDQTTHAIIGDGANVTAGRIGVGAQNRQPLNLLGLDRWSSLEDIYTNLKLLVQQKQGIVGKLATQYANSTGEADSLGMAGSLSILQNRTDATAWVGDNVTLTATALDNSTWVSNPLSLLPVIADDEARQALLDLELAWESPLSIRAENQLEQLAVSGNFGSLFGSTSDGGAVGAAVNVQITDNRAVAGIGAGGVLNAKALDVSALQDEMIIGLSPSAGKGASVAGNGSVVVSVVDSTVHASVHSSTDVTADRVRLDAEHQLGVWSAAGALASSENAGIGAGVAVNVVNTDVYALVGQNNLLTSARNSWRPASMGTALADATQGRWLVDDLTLSAQSSGQSGAFSVAGALARSEEEQQQQDAVAAQSGGADKGSQDKAGSLSEAIKTSLTNGLALITGEFSAAKDKTVEQGDAAVNKIGEYWTKLQDLFAGGSSGDAGNDGPAEGFSLAAAASGSVNVSAQKNRSHLGNIVLDPRNSDGGSQVNVLSLNQTHQFSGAGAGALTLSGGGDKSEFSTALSGAVAFNQLNNVTEAQVVSVIMTSNDLLNVQAASGGDQIALGLGLSVAKGGETNVAVALSGSAGVFGNQTRASVIDSVVSQRGDNPGSIAVNAYDRSRNLLGSGAFAVSTDKGGSGGGSFVVGVMQNQLEAEWLGSNATDFASLEIKANSISRVLAGAVGVAVSTGSESGAGAGSLFVVVMDNQVKARVDKRDQRDSSLSGGDVNVAAASVSGMDALASIFAHDAAAATTLSASGLDLDGNATIAQIEVEAQTNDELFKENDDGFDTNTQESDSTADTTTRNLFDSGTIGGEAILGIAGSLAATGGKTAVGGAFGVVYNGSDYAVSIANTDIDLTGDLRLAARNETDVLAGAIGAAGAQDVAVSGSATAIIGRGTVSANLDMSGRTLLADDLVVEALKSGGFYSLAGSISASSNTVAVGGAFSINDMQQGASAIVQGGTYQLDGNARINAAQRSRIITAALSAAVSASGVGVGAAMTYNRIADTTTAELLRATLSAHDLNIAASQPNLGASIWSLAFNLAAGGGSAGVGAGVAVNLIDAERAAKVTDSLVNLDGNLHMTSALDGEIWSIGIDAAGGGTAGVGGSFAFNNISGKDEVSVSGSTLTATATDQTLSLDASAGNGLTIASLAGSVTGGGTAAVGLAASVNRIAADRTALISDSSVTDFTSVALKAGVEQAIYSIAVAGGGAGSVAVNGATTTNILDGTERAAVVGSSLDVGALSLSTAQGKRTIWGLGLVLNGAGSVAVGAANVNNIILAKRLAEVDDSDLTLSGALTVASGGDALIRSAALGAGGAGSAAVGASVAVNLVNGEETARINDSSVDGASSLVVDVTRGEVDIKTLAGNVQGGGSGAGAGAVAVSTVSQRRQALVQNTTLNLSAAAPARVEALTRARIDTLALSGAGAGSAAVVFSNTTNNIDAKTYAKVSNSSGTAGHLQIKATDRSEINSLAGGVAAAGAVAVGVASAVNRIANNIEASLTGQRTAVGFALNELGVHARSDASIRTASVSGGFSGTAAVNGGVATSILHTSTRAMINGGADVLAQNNVAVVAYNRDVIDSYAGVVAGSGNAAVSGILTVNVVQSDTEAAIRGATTRVTALGLGAGVAVDSGVVTNAPNTQLWADAEEFNPVADLQTGSEIIRGLAVRATTLQQAGQMSVSGAVSLVPLASASVGGVSNTSVLGGSTLAVIDQAQINQDNAGAFAAQQVSVGAHAHSYSFGGVLNAALSLGAAAVAVTADTGVISRDVTAQVSGAKLASRGATSVKAGSTRSASSIVISASGAIVGVAGSASVLVLEGSTQARVDAASQLNVGSLAIKASASNYLSPNAQTVSGGAVGAGAGAGVGYNKSTVRAWLGAQPGSSQGRTGVITAGAVSVEAASLTDAKALSASVSGGGAAMAGSVNVLIVENVTEAGVGAVDLGSAGSRATSLKVDAYDRLEVNSIVGSGAAGGLALGASANVLVANNATRARVLNSNLWTTGAVGVTAQRESDIALTTVTGGVGGSVALGGSIGLIMLGSGTTQVDDSNAMDELNSGDAGTLSMIDGFTDRETADTQYQTLQLNDQTGEYELVMLDNSTETQWLNQQGQIGSSSDRFAAGAGDIYQHETLAQISGGQVHSGGLVTVSATDAIRTQNLVGSLQLSGTAAVGGVVGFTLSNSRVTAELKPVLLNSASVLLKADSFNLYNDKPAVLVDAYTGAAGFGVGLGAGVGIALMNNLVTASLDGTVNTSGHFNASARDALDLDVQVKGGQLGAAGAAGIVIGVGERASQVRVTVADDARLNAGGTLDFSAISEGASRVKAQGASGGILFGVQAAVVNARDTSVAGLTVGQRAHVTANILNLSAIAKPRLDAEGLGVAVGGYVAMGGTVLNAEALSSAYLDLKADSRLTARDANLRAAIERNGNADSVKAHGVGVVGGLGLSANAVVASARNTASSLLQSAESTRFQGVSDGNWSFVAATNVRQRASTQGITIGLLSVGAHVAEALANTSTQALLKGHFSGDMGALNVSASAVVDNEARSTAGQGGLISGAASLARTADTSTTKAYLDARGPQGSVDDALFRSVTLSALHQSHFNAFVDSVNASLVGASGAHALNRVRLNTTSELAGTSRLQSYAYEQSARSEVTKAASSDYNVKSGSGGVIDAAAALSESVIKVNTQSLVGDQAKLHLIGDFRVPQNMLIHAYNSVFARDTVKLDSGGAIAIAKADSIIDVDQAIARVTVGQDADLLSIGDIILSASGGYDIDARSNAKTWGLAGAAMGYSQARVNADYDVIIGTDSTLLGYGDIRLYAGQNVSGSSSQATLTARTDLWNNTAFPVVNKPDADAVFQRDSMISVNAGSEVNSIGDIFAYADKGYGNLLGKGQAKDLYTEALNALGLSVEITSGKQQNTSTAVVKVDGSLNSGYYNKRSVHITGLEYWVNGTRMTLEQISALDLDENSTDQIVIKPIVTTSDDDITFRLKEGTYSQYISQRVEALNKQLADYGLSPIERTAMQAELNVLQRTLTALFEQMGGDASQGASLARDQIIQVFELDPILAKPGNVVVIGDALIGSGRLRAPGDAAITVTNDSSAFLRIMGLEIPFREGGQLLFNLASLTSVDEINNANAVAYKGQASFGNVTVSSNSPDPVVTVINNYNPSTGIVGQDGLRSPAPDIYIDGRIFNQRGLVRITASYGSIYANSDIRGKTLEISAGRDFVLNAEDAFFHVGGDPATNNNGSNLTAPAAGSGVVAGNNVVISAQYLNINGLIQSGVANWTATIQDSAQLKTRIDAGRNLYQLGLGDAVISLQTTDARTGVLGYNYDFRSESVVLDAVEVAGGYMELTGYILSTGNGQLSVLDGYSQVGIINTSDYTLSLSGIDLGTGTKGTLRINDARRDGNGNEYVWSSIYTRGYDAAADAYKVYLQQGLSSAVLNATAVQVGSGRNTSYNPVTGRSYVWLTGQDQTETTVAKYYKDKFWGAFNVGEGTLYEPPKVWTGDPRPIDGADYMGNVDGSLASGAVNLVTDTFDTGEAPKVDVNTWTSCHKWFLWCQVKRSWLQTTTVQGQKVINRYTVRADNPINISFIGSDTGAIDLNSNGNVVLLGSLFNQNGTTNITTNGSLTQGAGSVVVQAANLNLQAGTGIGSATQALTIQVGDLLSAKSSAGDVNLRGLGGLKLGALEALRGNVTLSAQGNITTHNNAVTIKGHAINLSTTSGSIGASGNLLNLDTNTSGGSFGTMPATLTARAVGGVFLQEVSGDLLVDQVLAGGDVHLRVVGGDLIDANTTQSYDERTLDELKALWSDMGLTGQAALDALEQQKTALINAGQNSYERYWNLRTDKTTGVVGVFDLDQVQLSAAQIAQLKAQDWSDTQIAAEQARIDTEYDQLHNRFGSVAYDPGYQYQLSVQEAALLDATAAWSEDQLQYSVSSALLSRGTNTQSKIEDNNIEGANVTLEAYRIGQVLAEDIYIDLSVGIENLTSAQLAALAGAELDDVYFDDLNDKTKMRIVQRDDLNVSATGNLDVTAVKDVYLGGKNDFNIYNVQGDTVRIKTDGNIESANGSNVVITGHDVVLEASSGAIGGQGAVHMNVSGDLVARAVSLNLAQAGDLRVLRLTGSDAITLALGGNLLASGQNGEHLLGGTINLTIEGDLGSVDERIQLNSQTDEIALDIGGDAWIGAMQGVIVQPGNLNLGTVIVDGLLDIGQATTLTQSGDWSLGSLLLNLGSNWRMNAGTSVTAGGSLSATLGNLATLGDLTVTGNNGLLSLTASQLIANEDGVRWVSADRLALRSTGLVGGTGNIGQSTRHVILKAKELGVDASGQLFLDLDGGFERGSVVSAGNQALNTLGDSTLDRIESIQGMITLSGLGEIAIDQLQAWGDLDLAGSGLSLRLGSLRSQQGDLAVDIGGVFSADTVDAQNGLWNLIARQALIGTATIAGPVQMSITADLQLDLLNAGDDVAMVLGSASHIGELDIAGRFDLDVAGMLDLKRARVAGDASLHHRGLAGTPLRYDALTVDQTLSVTGAGDWAGRSTVVGGDVLFDVGTADLGSLESLTGTILLTSSGLFAADELHGRQQWIMLTAGSAELGNVSAHSQLAIEADGDLSIVTGRSGADMSLTTVAGSLGTIRFGTLADPDELNVLVPAHLKSAENLLVRTDGDVFGGNAEAEQLLRMEGRNLYFGRVQSLQGDVSLLGSGDYMDGHGDITGLLVEAFRDIGIIASGNLVMPEVKFGGTYSLKAGRDLTVGVRGDLNVQGEAEAGRDLFFDVGRNVDLRGAKAGRDVTVNAGGAINFDDRVEAGGNILLNAKGGDITVGGPMTSTGQYEGNPISGKISLTATGDITTTLVSTASLVDGNIDVQGQNLSLGNLSSSENIDLLARGSIQVGDSGSAGHQNWFADGDIDFQRLLAEGQAVLDSLLDTRGQSIRADQGITALAGWRNGFASTAALAFEEAIAPIMELRSGQSIRVQNASLGESADLYAQQIEFNGRHTGEGLLTLTVQGLNNAGQPGDSFKSRLDADHVVIDLLDMVHTELDTTALLVDFLDASNVDYLFLTTPQAVIIADNVNPTYRPAANVQLHELDKAFWLQQNGLGTYTNGYVIHRDYTHQVRVPNFAEGHQDGTVDYQNISAADYSVMMMTPQNIRLRLGLLMNQMAGYVPPVVSEISSEDDEDTMNMDWQAFSEQTGNEAQSWGI